MNRYECEYNESGLVTLLKDLTSGYFVEYKYNEIGLLIYSKKSDGTEEHCEYDEMGNLLHQKSEKLEQWFKYDEEGNLIEYKDSAGHIRKYKYDKYNNRIEVEDENGNITKDRCEYRFDEDGKLILFENLTQLIQKQYKYDINGELIYKLETIGGHPTNENGVREVQTYYLDGRVVLKIDDKSFVVHFKEGKLINIFNMEKFKTNVGNFRDSKQTPLKW